jgi:hypothetical protein
MKTEYINNKLKLPNKELNFINVDLALCPMPDNFTGHGLVFDWSLNGEALDKSQGRYYYESTLVLLCNRTGMAWVKGK